MNVHDNSVTPRESVGTDETRERLLDTAERLFAEKGFEGASVRDITAGAASNVASVNYHFGSKDNLYREVFRRRLGILRDRRVACVQEALTAQPAPSLEGVLEAFVLAFLEPLVEAGEGRLLMELWAREMLEPHLPHELFHREMLEPVRGALTDALLQVVPHLERERAVMAVFSLISQLVNLVHIAYRAGQHGLAEGDPWSPETLDRLAHHIVRFSAGGIRAVAGKEDES